MTNPRTGGPACPKTERLEEMMEWLTEKKTTSPPASKDEEENNNVLQEIIEALDWTHTMLSNRSTHQKKNQLLKKARYDWAKKNLSPEELKLIDEQVMKNLAERVGE